MFTNSKNQKSFYNLQNWFNYTPEYYCKVRMNVQGLNQKIVKQYHPSLFNY